MKKLLLEVYVEQDLWDRCLTQRKEYLEPLAFEVQHEAVRAAFQLLQQPEAQYETSESGILLNKTASTIIAPVAVLGGLMAWRENRMTQIKKEKT